ncbi:hypothetical protein ABTA76_20160, partial [Acinetobacter baumannii]
SKICVFEITQCKQVENDAKPQQQTLLRLIFIDRQPQKIIDCRKSDHQNPVDRLPGHVENVPGKQKKRGAVFERNQPEQDYR